MSDPPSEVTLLIRRAQHGDQDAGPRLLEIVYQKLHQMAEKKLAQEQDGISVQATVLVHDAYLQLVDAGEAADLNDRKHFYVVAAKVMRRMLIDRARARRALKRGGANWKRSGVELDHVADPGPNTDVLALHEALKQLATFDPRQAEIVEMRYFGGYTVEETADLLNVSVSTVKQDFAAAKAWLYRELTRGNDA
ncbi:ECF-type sigma factor [Bythopirellula polymerisocia]|uniref:RNA polymerase sigma factor SigK n=1 Tax=Bythopirellula polymerisocia TaxID=2528003 RepID=A0A5C6CDD8_9BACT|nr:ECF-type sigma factor [Bythopirellula polymerisocia]TWU22580.1 RNA polymerase sigma factor SigK [Bythopirellula polymerisocia]